MQPVPIKSDNTVSCNYDKRVIFGFISSIESSLDKNQIIPRVIYDLCLLFYENKAYVVFLKTIFGDVLDDGLSCQHQFISFDIDKKIFTQIIPKSMNSNLKYDFTKSLCHIPNISHFLSMDTFIKDTQIAQTKLHGIFGGLQPDRYSFRPKTYPYLLLYDANTHETKYEFISSSPIIQNGFCQQRQFLYLEQEQSIIYEYNGKLYQLKLNEIASIDDFGKFNEIKAENDHNIRMDEARWFEMVYLTNESSIFAMQCFINSRKANQRQLKFNGGGKRQMRRAGCAIFNTNTNEWTSTISDYQYQSQKTQKFELSAKYYDENSDSVYIIDMFGNLAMFNLKKEKWNTLCIGSTVKSSKIWLKDMVLYGLGNTMQDNYTLNRFDLRDSKQTQWISQLVQDSNSTIPSRFMFF